MHNKHEKTDNYKKEPSMVESESTIEGFFVCHKKKDASKKQILKLIGEGMTLKE
jgi:hypothetical protein